MKLRLIFTFAALALSGALSAAPSLSPLPVFAGATGVSLGDSSVKIEAANRKGSRRVGGVNKKGKWSRYYGGRRR